jgi:Sulfatase
MPSSLAYLTSRWAAASAATTWRDGLRVALVAIFHLAAIAIMLGTESAPEQKGSFILTWGLLNFFWLMLLRRPGIAGALSLAMVVALIQVSAFKYKVIWTTANFVDLMIIDPDTITFLLTIFPSLMPMVLAAVGAGVPALVMIWSFDPFRVRRLSAAVGVVGCLAGLYAVETVVPMEEFEGFYGKNYVSHFARSGVDAVSTLLVHGLMESDPVVSERLAPIGICEPTAKPPHIILVHDESAFDIRQAPGIHVPPNYGAHFRSLDGKQRKFIVEGTGGPSWYTEYNVLAGLAARSYGRFAYFVTRIAAGRVERGLPQALHRCGYETYSLYPAHGAFMSAGRFQKTTGIQHFMDSKAIGSTQLEPDHYYYDAATRIIEQERGKRPTFVYVYLAANHFPWDHSWRPELTPEWKGLGNERIVDEYLRRQTLGMRDYALFLAQLKRDFPNESFLVVRYGDHQPDFSSYILEPGIGDAAIAKRIAVHDPRYFTTYYAIDAVNFKPAAMASALNTIEGPYLPLVVLENAGLPLDSSFEEQKRIMQRCNGLFFDCNGGAEARRFNRMLIDAGMIQGL